MKKILLVALFMGTPFFVSALTADELRAQVEALLRQIDALQSQLGSQPMSVVPPQAVSGAVQCPYISRSLKLGSSGDDVARLQRFLALDPAIYPEAQVSGYYGPLTEAAIKRFQCKNKIVCDGTASETGYGVTGPRTAALLALQCPDLIQGGGGQGNVGGFMRITPISGVAPLATSIDVTVNTTRSCAAATYELDFGDGSPRVFINVPANGCNEVRQVYGHTFGSPGTYILTLRSGAQQVQASVTVTGTGGTSSGDTLSASPTSGATPLTVAFNGLINTAQNCGGSYSIDFGDNQSTPLSINGCAATSFSFNHVYNYGGNFIARLYRGSTEIRSISISAGGSGGGGGSSAGGGYFSVSPSGSGESYSVEADFELSSSCTRYDLDWGDGTAHSIQSQGNCSGGAITKQLNHTYTNAGNYTITLKRGANLSTTDTVGVTIVY